MPFWKHQVLQVFFVVFFFGCAGGYPKPKRQKKRKRKIKKKKKRKKNIKNKIKQVKTSQTYINEQFPSQVSDKLLQAFVSQYT